MLPGKTVFDTELYDFFGKRDLLAGTPKLTTKFRIFTLLFEGLLMVPEFSQAG